MATNTPARRYGVAAGEEELRPATGWEAYSMPRTFQASGEVPPNPYQPYRGAPIPDSVYPSRSQIPAPVPMQLKEPARMSQVEPTPTPEYQVPPKRAGAPMESPTVAIASGAVPAVAGLGSAALLAGGTAAGSAALQAAVWSSGIGAAASLIGLGVNTWMSLYAMKEQRKEVRRAEAINTKRYKDAVRTDEYRYERGQRLQEAEFAASQKWATLDRREKAKAALRDAMLAQPGIQQQLFNYNRMYRRS